MRDFGRAAGRLRNLPVLARLVYTTFLVFTWAGLALSAWLAEEMVGLELGGLGSYYAGAPGEAARPALDPGLDEGPALELPDELGEEPEIEPLPARKLLEVTHFHLFSMPVYLMILSHLFMLSRAGSRAKLWWIGAATVAVALHMLAPWVARTGGAGSALLYGGSGLLLLTTFGWISAVPAWEMWAGTASGATQADAGAAEG